MNKLTHIDLIESVKEIFTEAAKHHNAVSFTNECLFAKQLLESNSYLMNIAMANPSSLKNAITNIASIGISLNPALKMAYLVPRDNKICLDVGYIGLCHLAQETGSIRWVQAEPVYSNDEFLFNGPGNKATHKFNPFNDRGELVGVYVTAKTSDDDYLVNVMKLDEIYSIRDRSVAWKAWLSKKKSCPWVTDEGEMIKKTAIKRASKLWPKSERTYRLETAISAINEHEGIDFNSEQESTENPSYDDKNKKIDEIKSMLTIICKDKSPQEKGAFLIKECGVNRFDILFQKSFTEINNIHEKLSSLSIIEKEPIKTIKDQSFKI